jgi:hypothetical protein
MRQKFDVVNLVLCLAGGVVGGLLGYWACAWMAGQGFIAVVLPGAGIGLGCGALARRSSLAIGLVAGLAALAVGVYATWRVAPFVADDSLGFFLQHLGDVQPAMLLMIAFGGLCGFWFGRRREGGPWKGSDASK